MGFKKNFDSEKFDTVDFLEKCKKAGKKCPPSKEMKPWYDSLSEERKEENRRIVFLMTQYADGFPEIFDPKYDCYPHIYYNGLKKYRNSVDTAPIIERTEHLPTGRPCILPVFYVDENIAYLFDKLLQRFGYYVECWNDGCYEVADEGNHISSKEFKNFKKATGLMDEIRVTRHSEYIPKPLLDIAKAWGILSDQTGDSGSCVIGEGMIFTYGGQKYKMAPCSMWQGEGSWTPHVDYIKACLIAAGAQKVSFDCGYMD